MIAENPRRIYSEITILTVALLLLLSGGVTDAQSDTTPPTSPNAAETVPQDILSVEGKWDNTQYPELVQSLCEDLNLLTNNSQRMGFVFSYEVDGQEQFSCKYNTEKLFPMASVFKMWVAASYYHHVPQEQWNDQEDSSLYRMLVASNNVHTGQVLVETAAAAGVENPIVLFNDYLRDVVGLENTGIYSWAYPGTPSAGFVDERFIEHGMLVDPDGKLIHVSNVMTPEQAHKGMQFIANSEHNPLWESSPKFKAGMRNLIRILGIQHPTYKSLVERMMYDFTWGKDGTLQPGDIAGSDERVNNDIKVIPRGNGNYLISMFGWGADEVHIDPVLERIIQAIQEQESLISPESAQTFVEESAPVRPGVFNYGWVKSDQIPLYLAPDENAERYENFVREGRISITWYVMQGAMLRVMPIDETWAEVLINDDRDLSFVKDNVRVPIFVKFEDLHLIDPVHFTPIEYLSRNPDGTALAKDTRKNILIDVPGRRLMLLEGEQIVFTTPVVLNAEAPEWPDSTLGTPREHSYAGKNVVTRNMPDYPGVGFSVLLVGKRKDGTDIQDTGYYIHSSPWQRWEQMTHSEVLRRRSSGCINVPSWYVELEGIGKIRVDELIFRWTGGNPDADTSVIEYQQGTVTPITRIYVVDTYADIAEGSIGTALRGQGLNPYNIHRSFINPELKITAPAYFFDNKQ